MVKRALAVWLWFVAVACTYGLVAYATGLPNAIGPFLGVAVAAFVGLDPARRIWIHEAR